jgi:hypothetical protein
MQLSIPIFYKDNIYDQCEIQKPKAGVLANTLEVFQNKGDFSAILEFISKSIVSFTSIDNKIIDIPDQIKAICRRMSYITAEVIAIKTMLLINKDDWIEGVYECPRCKRQIITGIDHDTGEDNRDQIEDLKIINQGENDYSDINQDDYNDIIHINLVEPIRIIQKQTNTILHEIDTIDMRFPNLDDCIKGTSKYPGNKEAKRQFAIYAESLEKINGEEIKIKWQRIWGEFIFREMNIDDLSFIGETLQKYGLQRQIEKVCRYCGKVWDAPVNTSNFFESGLRST